jgi:hypothetical protein
LLQKTIFVTVVVLASLVEQPAAGQVFHDPRKKESVGFSVDLEYPAEAVAPIVKSVASDKTIRGSKISTKDKEMEIGGAEFAANPKIFADDVSAPGTIFYKIKGGAIAPIHFPGSNGSGTVAVRYVVQPLTPERTRLLIDAVFFQDSLHARYFSDGNVESAEYNAILDLLKNLDSSKHDKNEPSPLPAKEADSAGLESTLADLKARLADARGAEDEMEKRIEQLKFNTDGQIKTEAVPLKALPYNRSSTIETLEKGEAVTVLATSKYWYRVRTPKGEEGWVYYAFLGPLS